MNGKIVKINIDHREYLFKLSTEEEVDRLKQLAAQLEKRIQFNKRSVATTDYNKILIITCLDLLEEINRLQQTKTGTTTSKTTTSNNNTSNQELVKKLSRIHSLLKNNSHDLS